MDVDGFKDLAPPGLIPGIDAFATPSKDVPNPGKVRTRRSVNTPPTAYTRGKVASVYDPQIDAILAAAGIKKPQADSSAAKSKMRKEIRRGVFDPIYWVDAKLISSETLASFPTSIPDLDPPPFPYQDPDNMPSIPTYWQGESTTGDPVYNGQQEGLLYVDKMLKWQRLTYEFTGQVTDDLLTHPLIHLSMTQEIATTNRGVRTLQDCAVMAWLHAPGDLIEQTLTPPVHADYSAAPPDDATYWRLFFRYEVPLSSFPYYVASNEWTAGMRAVAVAQIRGSEPATRLTILIAPRPAYGLEYANNTAMTQATSFAVQVHQPTKWFEATLKLKWQYISFSAPPRTIRTAGGAASMYFEQYEPPYPQAGIRRADGWLYICTQSIHFWHLRLIYGVSGGYQVVVSAQGWLPYSTNDFLETSEIDKTTNWRTLEFDFEWISPSHMENVTIKTWRQVGHGKPILLNTQQTTRTANSLAFLDYASLPEFI